MNKSYTENGALQYENTGSCNLDLFSTIGASRVSLQQNPTIAVSRLQHAYREDPKTAISIVYWARAIREGSGERQVFYTYLKELYKMEKQFVLSNLLTIAELGYWKDFVNIYNTDWADKDLKDALIQNMIIGINKNDGLVFKWAPRKGNFAKDLRDALKITNKEYRHLLLEGSKTVEQQMTKKQWDDIDYEKTPSKAFKKYSQAFARHDEARFVSVLTNPESKLCAGAIYPHEVLKSCTKNNIDILTQEAQWKNLPNYIKEGSNILPLIDVSGSMNDGVGSTTAMHIAISLGLYCTERIKGRFKNKFITFSETPEMISVPDNMSITNKYMTVKKSHWGGSTNFESAYMTILNSAIMWNIPKKEMPSMLLVLSDMQFNEADRNSRNNIHLENIKIKFQEAGYEMPMLVFWNLRDADTGTPATKNDNVALISGFSPQIMKSVLGSIEIEINTDEKHNIVVQKTIDPIKVMMTAIQPIKDKLDFTSLTKDFSENVYHRPTNSTYSF